jgi:superfamily II DNA helicase RecQ
MPIVPVDPILRAIIATAFYTFHRLVPKEWQVEAVSRVLRTTFECSSGPVPMLLCRPTGGGKSAVRDCAGLLLGGGVVFTWVPLLALAGDQTSKIRQAGKEEENILVFNLDEYKSSRQKNIYKNRSPAIYR